MPRTLTAEELIEQLKQVPSFTPVNVDVSITLAGTSQPPTHFRKKLPVTSLHTTCNEVQLEARG